MTTLLIIGCAALVAGTIALILAYTESCRPNRNRPAVAVALVVGALLVLGGFATVVQQVTAPAAAVKVSVSGKADLSTPAKEVVR